MAKLLAYHPLTRSAVAPELLGVLDERWPELDGYQVPTPIQPLGADLVDRGLVQVVDDRIRQSRALAGWRGPAGGAG
jgi:hypothetical protein